VGVRSAPVAREPVTSVAHGSGVGTMVRGDEPPLPEVHPHLSRSVRAELVFAAVVLAFTSVLVNTSPPHETLKPTEIAGVIGTGPVRFDVFFGPAEVGKPNTLHITALNRGGLAVRVVDMSAELANPDKDIPPIPLPIHHVARGHYIGEGIRVPAGRWVLTIRAYPTQTDVVTATADVTVG
jgi:hypothetical protein